MEIPDYTVIVISLFGENVLLMLEDCSHSGYLLSCTYPHFEHFAFQLFLDCPLAVVVLNKLLIVSSAAAETPSVCP